MYPAATMGILLDKVAVRKNTKQNDIIKKIKYIHYDASNFKHCLRTRPLCLSNTLSNKLSQTHSHSHTHTLNLFFSLTHSLTYSLSLTLTVTPSLYLCISHSLSHSHTLSLSLSTFLQHTQVQSMVHCDEITCMDLDLNSGLAVTGHKGTGTFVIRTYVAFLSFRF